jgi:hypothetical protein
MAVWSIPKPSNASVQDPAFVDRSPTNLMGWSIRRSARVSMKAAPSVYANHIDRAGRNILFARRVHTDMIVFNQVA